MAGNTFGEVFKVTTFGESHGEALGTVIDGMIPGIPLDEIAIQRDLDRRRPGATADGKMSAAVTPRNESDKARILSGVFEGKTTGTPIAIIIENTSQHSSDYAAIASLFRPGHADYTFTAKYGFRDYRGGGRSSGRETAARVAAGAIAKLLLAQYGIRVTAWTAAAAGIVCNTFEESVIEQNSLRACDSEAAIAMETKLEALRIIGDSAGGIISCRITGLPAGLGEPVFDKFDAEIAKAVLSIGAVKGIEFGAGFASAAMTGSMWNDAMHPVSAENSGNSGRSGSAPAVVFKSNKAGGILGGITTGADVQFRVAVKPVPSISTDQQTIDTDGQAANISVTGRHDVCLCPRIVPVIEAMAAITVADMLLRQNSIRR